MIFEYKFFVIFKQLFVKPLQILGIVSRLYFLLFGSSLSGEYPKKNFLPITKLFKYGEIKSLVEPG